MTSAGCVCSEGNETSGFSSSLQSGLAAAETALSLSELISRQDLNRCLNKEFSRLVDLKTNSSISLTTPSENKHKRFSERAARLETSWNSLRCSVFASYETHFSKIIHSTNWQHKINLISNLSLNMGINYSSLHAWQLFRSLSHR